MCAGGRGAGAPLARERLVLEQQARVRQRGQDARPQAQHLWRHLGQRVERAERHKACARAAGRMGARPRPPAAPPGRARVLVNVAEAQAAGSGQRAAGLPAARLPPRLWPRCAPAARAAPPRAHRARARAAARRAARRARACSTGSSPAGARAPPRTSGRRRARPPPRPSADSPPRPGPSSWGTRSRSPAHGARVGSAGASLVPPPRSRGGCRGAPGSGRSALAGGWTGGPAGARASRQSRAAGRAARLARGPLVGRAARARGAPARARAAWRARPGGCRRCARSAPPARRSGPPARAPPAPPPPARPPGRAVARAPGVRAHSDLTHLI